MEVKRTVSYVSVLFLLVLVLGVTGAFSDPVTSGKHSDLVTFDSIHGFSPVTNWHSDFGVNGVSKLDGLHTGFWFHDSLGDGPKADLSGSGGVNPPPTATPEPASIYLLALGAGLLFFGMGRRATES